MPQGFADPQTIRSYHAHIYYDPETRALEHSRIGRNRGKGIPAQAKV